MKKKFVLAFVAMLTSVLPTMAQGEDPTPQWYEINVADQNTLAVLIANALDGEKTMADVQYLRVTGTLGDQDITTLRYTLTGLVELDMAGVDMTTLPNNMLYNDNNNKNSLQKLILPSNLEAVGNYGVRNCRNLAEVVFPSTLKTIGEYAFYQCYAMSHLNLAATQVETISTHAFRNCIGLVDITWPTASTLKTIATEAFENCSSLLTVTLPEGITTLGGSVFYNCTALTHAVLPSTLSDVPSYTFYGCSSLESVTLPHGIASIGNRAFYGCKNLVSVELPATVRTVGEYAFNECNALSFVLLNEGLREIAYGAFQYCRSLTEITFPSTLIHIGTSILNNATNLQHITCKAYLPPKFSSDSNAENSGLMGNANKSDIPLTVPAVNRGAYIAALGWNKFNHVTGDESLYPEMIDVYTQTALMSPANQPDGWKPDLYLRKGSEVNSTTNYQYNFGAMHILGDTPLTLSNLSLYYDEYARRYYNSSYYQDATYHSTLLNDNPVTADRVKLTLRCYTPSSGVWHFVGFPFDINLANHNFNSQLHYAIYGYDGEKRARGENAWTRIADDGRLEAGRGYILMLHNYLGTNSYSGISCNLLSDSSADRPVVIPHENVSIALEEYPAEYEHNSGWNFIANPYMAYFDTRFMEFDAPITVRDISGNTYSAYSLLDDSYILNPGESFFAQCSVSANTLTFLKDGRQMNGLARSLEPSEAPLRRAAARSSRSLINLTLSCGDRSDRTRVVINPDASRGYEYDKDAPKFMTDDAAMFQFYTTTDGVDYAINERPFGDGIVDLGTLIPADGEYTIALTSPVKGYTVELMDTEARTATDLTAGSYTFTAKAGENSARFMLRLTANTTDIEGVRTEGGSYAKGIYTLSGMKVNDLSKPGFYIVNGKKIVIK